LTHSKLYIEHLKNNLSIPFFIGGSSYRGSEEPNDIDILIDNREVRKLKNIIFCRGTPLVAYGKFKFEDKIIHFHATKMKYFPHFKFLLKGPSSFVDHVMELSLNKKNMYLTHFGFIKNPYIKKRIKNHILEGILEEDDITITFQSEKEISKFLLIDNPTKEMRKSFE